METQRPQIPAGTLKQYLPLRYVGQGKDATIFAALLRNGKTVPYLPAGSPAGKSKMITPPATPSCSKSGKEPPTLRKQIVAVKIYHRDTLPDSPPQDILGTNHVRQILSAQKKEGNPMPRLIEMELHMRWYSMQLIPGKTVQQLLESDYAAEFPPFLVAHLFLKLSEGIMWLHREGMSHYDLSAGGNVLLRPIKPGDMYPEVTILDFEGLMPCKDDREHESYVCGEVLTLMTCVTQDAPLVPPQWRQYPGGHHREVATMDQFYHFAYQYQTLTLADTKFFKLSEVFSTWETALYYARSKLVQQGTKNYLEEVLSDEPMKEEDIREIVKKGGIEVEVLKEDMKASPE